MTTEQRIKQVQHHEQCDSRFASVCGDSQRCSCGLDWLLAELDVARAREAKLRAALEQLVEPMSSRTVDTGVVRQKMLVVSGDDAMDRYRQARAALAEGEDTK